MKKINITAILIITLIINIIPASQADNQNEQKIDVIIKLKDNNAKTLVMTTKEQNQIKTKIIESQKDFAEKIGKEKIKIKNTLTTQNVFSASVDLETYEALKKNPEVEYVLENIKLKINLETSTELINATRTREHQINGINITGEGTSVCIIDTGIDYTHEAFGSCTNMSLQATGDEEELLTESIHPYESNYTNTTTITMPGYTSIAVHFKNISIENGYDYVYILDSNDNVLQTYTGFHENIWSPHVEGDTIKIKVTSDGSVTDYGYYSDKVLNGTTQRTCEKVPTGYDFVNNDDDPLDDQWHGTHVAGIVSADGTIKGVAPKAKIIAAKAMNENGTGDSLVITSAIEWCILNKEAYNITAISMSLGSETYFDNYCDSAMPIMTYMINNAIRKNISVVIATGNENQYSQISFPSCITNATRVTATSSSDTFASFANRGGEFNDILTAPGVNINSAQNGGGWVLSSGTSMSTPHISGAIALIKHYLQLTNKTKTPKQIEQTLNNTGVKLFDSESQKNYSRINILSAIYFLTEQNPTILNYEPTSNDVLIRKNNSITFNHTSSDEFNKTIYYYWYLDEQLESNEQNFTLNSTEFETGNYTLELVVSNNETNTSINWNLNIVNPPIVQPSKKSSGGGGGGSLPLTDLTRFSEIIIEADKEIKITNTNEKVPFKELEIKINKKILNARIIVEALKENPEQTKIINEKIYKTISITHTNIEDSDIDEVKIKFSVEKNWTINNSVEKEKIKILRYSGNEWKEIDTRYLSFDSNNYYFESLSPGLSLFAITAEEEKEEQTPEVAEPEFDKTTPGIELEIKKENETLIDKEQLTPQETKKESKFNEITVKILSAVLSIIGMLLVITIINELAKKKAKKMLIQKEKEEKSLKNIKKKN